MQLYCENLLVQKAYLTINIASYDSVFLKVVKEMACTEKKDFTVYHVSAQCSSIFPSMKLNRV